MAKISTNGYHNPSSLTGSRRVLHPVRASGVKVERRLLFAGSWSAHLTIFRVQGGSLLVARRGPVAKSPARMAENGEPVSLSDTRTCGRPPPRLQGASQAVGACPIAGAPSQACLEPIPFSPSAPLPFSPAPSQPWRESSGWLFAHFHTTRARPRATHDRSGRRRQVTNFLPVHSRRWAVAAWFP